jgi:methyl-accepting chemotaxis protein
MHFSLRAKQLGSAGLLVALIIVVGVLGVRGLGSVADKSELAYTEATLPLSRLADAGVRINENRALVNQHILETGAEARQALEQQVVANDEATARDLAAVEPVLHGSAAEAAFAALTAAAAEYAEVRERVFELSDAGRDADALALYQERAIPLATEVHDQFQLLLDSKVERARVAHHESEDTYAAHRTISIVLLVAAALIGFAVAFLIARQVVGGVRQLARAADGIAEGDIDQRISVRSRDEVRATADSFERMIGYLKEMSAAADRVAANDLTVDVAPRSDRDALGVAIHGMVTSLRAIVTDVSSNAETVSAASQQMASSSDEAGRAVGAIADAVSEVATGAERQVRMIDAAQRSAQDAAGAAEVSAERAQQTAVAAAEARDAARGGVDAAERATGAIRDVADSSAEVGSAIDDLAARSERIGGIVDTITAISEQTNLLALNAAIEAARAGEQGRGFAVVAEEVRKLAEESSTAAGEISTLIGEMQTETERVVAVVAESGKRTTEGVDTVAVTRDAFERIGTAVENMTARITEIADAAHEMSAGTQQMEANIAEVASVAEESSASAEQVSASTQETSASTEEIAASAQELARTAEQLAALVGRFKLTA